MSPIWLFMGEVSREAGQYRLLHGLVGAQIYGLGLDKGVNSLLWIIRQTAH